MQHLLTRSPKSTPLSLEGSSGFNPGKVLRCVELNHMLHRLCGPPSIPLSFSLAPYSPGGVLNALASAPQGSIPAAPSTHRLRRGLPGYLILFAPHAFAPQRQYWPRSPPSPLVFLPISTNFTSTPRIPRPSSILELPSFGCTSSVEPRDFTSDLGSRLRALYAQ